MLTATKTSTYAHRKKTKNHNAEHMTYKEREH